MRHILSLLLAIFILFSPSLAGAKRGASSHGRSSSSKSATGKTVHVRSYKKKDGTVVRAHDRRQPGTAHDSHGRIKRSGSAKHDFMRQTGYLHGRPGYVVDHIVPLACGGSDSPSNMQWQTKAEAKAKDKIERKGCR